jgi:hypothetical protein
MALVSPLKQDLDKAQREVEVLNRLYNVYFQGGEDEPPKTQRKQLDALIAKIKAAARISTNAADKFLADSVTNKFQMLSVRWDKTMRDIESGIIPKPKKRK